MMFPTYITNVLWDPNISLEARGIFMTLAYAPPSLRTLDYLCQVCPDDRQTLMAGMQELTNAGFLPIKDGDGNE